MGRGTHGSSPSILPRALVAIGVALIAIPIATGMFGKAPQGAEMMGDFKGFMESSTIERFEGYMENIGAAAAATESQLSERKLSELPNVTTWQKEWPELDELFTDEMLVPMSQMTDNFDAISSMPSFRIFPFAFLGLGLLVVAAGAVSRGSGRRATTARRSLIVLGILLVIGPVAAGMLPKSSQGAEMMDEMGPLMTRSRLQEMQRSFLVIGGAESELRNDVMPELGEDRFATQLPAAQQMIADWPRMSGEMAPMMGAMADNLDNFAALRSLPPFGTFPWMFIVPGALIAGLAAAMEITAAPSTSRTATVRLSPRRQL